MDNSLQLDNKSRKPWILPGDIQHMTALALATGLTALPSGVHLKLLAVLSRIGSQIWRIIDRDTHHRIRRHLAVLFGVHLPGTALEPLVQAQLELSIWNALILSLLPSLRDRDLANLVQVEGLHYLNEARELGKPIVLFGAHYGVYGYAVTALLSSMGYATWLVGYGDSQAPPKTTSRLYNWLYWPRVQRLTQRLHQTTVTPGAEQQPELEAILEKGTDIFYLLPDQYFIVEPGQMPPPYLVSATFLGHRVYLDTSAVRLVKERAATVFTAIPLKDERQQHLIIEPLSLTSASTDAAAIGVDLQAYLKRLEAQLMNNPALWRDLRRGDLLARMGVYKEAVSG